MFGGKVIKDHHLVDVFIGVDVGQSNHHAVAIDRDDRKPLDKALPQNEAHLRRIIGDPAAHGTLLLVVGQPLTTGTLPVAVAQAEGIQVGYLPALAMRRLRICTPEERNRMRGTQRSSLRLPGPCQAPCAPSPLQMSRPRN
jgi:hypothetical protein